MSCALKTYQQFIHKKDCFDFLPTLDDKSIDCIITDPPYGIGLDHWDNEQNIELFFKEAHRVLKDDSFIVFFGQMPTLINWCNHANNYFEYQDHISWVKRINTAIYNDLKRTHESIMIYKKGKPRMNENRGNYSDVQFNMLHAMPEYITGIQRTFSELEKQLKGGKATIIKTKEGTTNKVYKDNYRDYSRTIYKEIVKFSNVWSFLPENAYSATERIDHPTVKPSRLMSRLVRLVTFENDIILDPFLGSGSTAIAAINNNREIIGIEKDDSFYDLALKRIEKETRQVSMF